MYLHVLVSEKTGEGSRDGHLVREQKTDAGKNPYPLARHIHIWYKSERAISGADWISFLYRDLIRLKKRNEDVTSPAHSPRSEFTRLKNKRCDNISSLNPNKSSGRVRTPFEREIHFHTTITWESVALRNEEWLLREHHSYCESLFLYDLLP